MTEIGSGVCFFCGETNPHALEEHHLVPQRFNGSDAPENTVMLCGTCHNKIEDLYDNDFYRRLGVAVDEIDNESFDYESGGKVPKEKSLDRMIPPRSAHIRVERIDGDGEPGRKYYHGFGSGGSDSEQNWPISEVSESIHGSPEIGGSAMRVDYPDYYRLHCAYCHTVYSRHEHSDMARHLRVKHGIEDPYEVQDTTFGNVPESGPLGELFSDKDD